MNLFPGKSSAEMSLKEILYEKKEMVARVTINRPEAYNAYTTNTLRELAAALTDASQDESPS